MKIFHAMGGSKHIRVKIVFSEILNIKPKFIKSSKKEHHTAVKRNIHQEKIKIMNIYPQNYHAHNFIKH